MSVLQVDKFSTSPSSNSSSRGKYPQQAVDGRLGGLHCSLGFFGEEDVSFPRRE